MSSNPKVTVIIIFLNAGETFFKEAIDSVFAQTYDNWELLLVDDGSTDISTEIACQYVAAYPHKVRYLEHEAHQNRGMSATRNLGIQHARGEFIALLDADDLWLPQKLAEQVAILEAHPEAAMLYGRTQYWFSWMENNPTMWKLDPTAPAGDFMTISSYKFNELVESPTQLILFLQNKNIYPCTCSVLIRRQVFDEIGGFEEDFKNAHEDMVFYSKVFLKAPVYVSSQCWDKYRMHPHSYWRSADRQGIGDETRQLGHIKYLTWLRKYISSQENINPNIEKLIERALLAYQNPLLYRLIISFEQPSKQNSSLLIRQIVNQVLPDRLRLWLKQTIFISRAEMV